MTIDKYIACIRITFDTWLDPPDCSDVIRQKLFGFRNLHRLLNFGDFDVLFNVVT
jgi:hypothetical protein